MLIYLTLDIASFKHLDYKIKYLGFLNFILQLWYNISA